MNRRWKHKVHRNEVLKNWLVGALVVLTIVALLYALNR